MKSLVRASDGETSDRLVVDRAKAVRVFEVYDCAGTINAQFGEARPAGSNGLAIDLCQRQLRQPVTDWHLASRVHVSCMANVDRDHHVCMRVFVGYLRLHLAELGPVAIEARQLHEVERQFGVAPVLAEAGNQASEDCVVEWLAARPVAGDVRCVGFALVPGDATNRQLLQRCDAGGE